MLGESGDFGDGDSALLTRGEVGADMVSYSSIIDSTFVLFEMTLSYFFEKLWSDGVRIRILRLSV